MQQEVILPDIIERVVIDRSHGTSRYILVSHNKKYIQLSPQAYAILEQASAGIPFATIAQNMSLTGKAMVSAEEIQSAYQYVLEKIKNIHAEPFDQQKSFWFKKSIIPASRVITIASRLTFMFHPLVAFLFLCSWIILLGYATEHNILGSLLVKNFGEFIFAYLLFLLSVILHEFGHATACLRGGSKPSDIGFTFYLVFPTFYSNVSDSWQLSRWKKVRVDVGGLYFQMCIGTIYLALFLLTGWAVLQLAVLMILGTCTINLNPFAKFDGYWIISDLFGITNLSQQPGNVLNYFYRAIRRLPNERSPFSLAMNVFIGTYGLMRITFWSLFLFGSSFFLWNSVRDYPSLILSIINLAQTGHNYLPEVQKFFMQSFPLLLWSIMLIRTSQFLFLCWQRLWMQHKKQSAQ